MTTGRRSKPYTDVGVRRLECFRAGCTNRAETQWQICSDGNTWRPVCWPCDVELNRLVLEWAGFVDVDERIRQYEATRGAA